MGAPVVLPINQFCDENGIPYAGGTIDTWVPGTTTGKSTFTDPGLTALNPNPVRLDSAGRCVMWADGDLRLVLRDAAGNLVWDELATTIVSAAMAPVVSAPTIPDALNLLGINALIAAEATARSNADSAEQSARIAADNAEATARANGDAALNTLIGDEITRAMNEETGLQNQINALPPPVSNAVTMQTGTGTSSSSTAGAISVTFGTAYVTHTQDFNLNGGALNPDAFFSRYQPVLITPVGSVTLSGATGYMCKIDPSSGDTIAVAGAAFTWFAIGH
jgi:hypothetical protein